MAKLIDAEGITSFQKIRQLSEEIAQEIFEEQSKPSTNIPIINFWDFEEFETEETMVLTPTKQVA